MKKFGFVIFTILLLGATTSNALAPKKYSYKIKPNSELNEYILQQSDVSEAKPSSVPMYQADVWKQDEVRYRDLDALNSRYTSQEKEITSDGILGNGLKKEFKF